MKKFYIIGIDDNGQREFQAEVREIITTHRVFSGGKRHYELMRDRLPEQYVWIDITVPLEEVFEKYAAYCEVVVFASGDPLFFGFANTVKSRLPEAEIQVFPWFNSLQMLAHRLVIPYQDMGRIGLINSGGESHGESDLKEAVITAVVNKRAGGMGLISGRKAFQKPMAEGVQLLHAIQDVYLDSHIKLA